MLTGVNRPQPGLMICVSGPSGVGKGTVIRQVMALRPELSHSVSVTTRAPRPGEREGVDYFYRSCAEFRQMLERGDILEHDCYCGHYYGTPRQLLVDQIAAGRDVLLDITVPGSLAIMRQIPDCITLFLLPPSISELEQRLQKRGTEAADVMHKRLQKARDEVALTHHFHYVIVNDTIAGTARQILAIIDAEHCRYHRQAGIETTVLAR
jgi:guanylate kinase